MIEQRHVLRPAAAAARETITRGSAARTPCSNGRKKQKEPPTSCGQRNPDQSKNFSLAMQPRRADQEQKRKESLKEEHNITIPLKRQCDGVERSRNKSYLESREGDAVRRSHQSKKRYLDPQMIHLQRRGTSSFRLDEEEARGGRRGGSRQMGHAKS